MTFMRSRRRTRYEAITSLFFAIFRASIPVRYYKNSQLNDNITIDLARPRFHAFLPSFESYNRNPVDL